MSIICAWPCVAAQCKNVSPFLFILFVLAPALISSDSAWQCPNHADHSNAFMPNLSWFLFLKLFFKLISLYGLFFKIQAFFKKDRFFVLFLTLLPVLRWPEVIFIEFSKRKTFPLSYHQTKKFYKIGLNYKKIWKVDFYTL